MSAKFTGGDGVEYIVISAKEYLRLQALEVGATDPRHVVEFTSNGWVLLHPIACRSGDAHLLDCEFTRAAIRVVEPDRIGRYYCTLNADGWLVTGAPMTVAFTP